MLCEIHTNSFTSPLLEEVDEDHFVFTYLPDYKGPSVSLTMPISKKKYTFDEFPPFFEGLLPEGNQLESLLRREKIDKDDFFSQLLTVGADLVGDVTVEKLKEIDK